MCCLFLIHFDNGIFSANTLNWALNQKATHSSTQGNLGADKAVDGNYDGYYPACSETKKSTNPWWQVQLENEIEVQEVTIINRADCCGKCKSSNNTTEMGPLFKTKYYYL